MNRKEVSLQLEKLDQEIGRLERLQAELDLLPKLHAVQQALIALGDALPRESREAEAVLGASGVQNAHLDAVREAISAHGGDTCTALSKRAGLSSKIVSMALRKLVRSGEIATQGHARSKIYFLAQQANGAAILSGEDDRLESLSYPSMDMAKE